MSEHGAFVEMDVTRLDREGLVLLGMKEGLDRWIDKLRHLSGSQHHPGVAQVMQEVANGMAEDRDGIAVALTKRAVTHKAAEIINLRREND